MIFHLIHFYPPCFTITYAMLYSYTSVYLHTYIHTYRHLTNRFQVAVHLFSNRSQMMAHKVQLSVSLMFLPHFDILCDLLLNRCMATWNLFVLYNKELKKVSVMTSSVRLCSSRSSVRTNQNACVTELII